VTSPESTPLRCRGLATILALAFVLVLYSIWSAEVIDLFFGGTDLGRHLKNGELLLSSTAPAGTASKILHTNFYSYTEPGFAFINHHWLAGVVFFLVWKVTGFAGLNVFYILVGAAALLISWRMAQKAAGWAIPTAMALLIMPIVRARPSVRPEIFSVLFCSIFLWILWEHYRGSPGWRVLMALPALEILWVNLHIGFIFGPVFVGAFLLGALLERPPKGDTTGNNAQRAKLAKAAETEFFQTRRIRLKRLSGILALTLAATLVNPSGIQGALYPFTIWGNYGLDMIENHSIPYLESNGYQGEFFAIKLTLLVLWSSFAALMARRRRIPLPLLALAGVMSVMAWLAIRNQTLLAVFAIAAVGVNAGLSGVAELRARWRVQITMAATVVIIAGVCYNGYRLLTRKEQIGLGLKPGTSAPADFLRASHLAGPMLNNLSIGGYLTFYLFPQYRIYVDARPEAFPAAFMQEKYKEPLTDETRWKQLLEEYHFNLICSSGSTAWENRFILTRAKDPEWAVIYAQDPSIILARRTPANQSFIQQHEVPKDRIF
jgi:hypothetical protein